jgi:hypothetical protein
MAPPNRYTNISTSRIGRATAVVSDSVRLVEAIATDWGLSWRRTARSSGAELTR